MHTEAIEVVAGEDEKKEREIINLLLKEMDNSLKISSSNVSEEEVFNKTVHKYGLFGLSHSEEMLQMLKNYSKDTELLKIIKKG